MKTAHMHTCIHILDFTVSHNFYVLSSQTNISFPTKVWQWKCWKISFQNCPQPKKAILLVDLFYRVQ